MPTTKNGNMFDFDLLKILKDKESLNLEIVQKKINSFRIYQK